MSCPCGLKFSGGARKRKTMKMRSKKRSTRKVRKVRKH